MELFSQLDETVPSSAGPPSESLMSTPLPFSESFLANMSSPTVVPETQECPLDLSVSPCTQPTCLDSSHVAVCESVSDECTQWNTLDYTSCSDTTSDLPEALHLFRGPKNALSAFFQHPLKWNDMHFNSAEQAYQFEKLLFHKVSRFNRNRLMNCRQSHEVKHLSTKLVPVCSAAWDNVKFDIMEEICTAKLSQCKKFRDALLSTGNARLVHNTETDPVWGCGRDFQGMNMMGVILMTIRQRAARFEQEFPPLPPRVQRPPRTEPCPRSEPPRQDLQKPRSIVIGNSNVRGIASQINMRGVDCTGFTFPGRSTRQIRERLPHLSPSDPDSVVCHTGDIDIRDLRTSVPTVVADIVALVRTAENVFPRARIIVSSLPPVRSQQKQLLNNRIQQVNSELAELCASSENCVYLCNAGARLSDSIHLSDRSKEFVARTAAHFTKQCV